MHRLYDTQRHYHHPQFPIFREYGWALQQIDVIRYFFCDFLFRARTHPPICQYLIIAFRYQQFRQNNVRGYACKW